MQFVLVLLIVLTFSVMLPAQTRIYSGHSANWSDCLFTIRGEKVYEGNSTNYSDCLLTIKGNKVLFPDAKLKMVSLDKIQTYEQRQQIHP